MMSNRFSPDWQKVKKLLDRLIETLSVQNGFLVDAYESASNHKAKTIEEVKTSLRASVMAPGIPWLLYDTLTTLIKRLPQPTRGPIIEALEIETGHANELLRPNLDGNWQTAWRMGSSGDGEDEYIALDWYIPPEQERAPIVPITIIDYIAGCVSLLQSNLLLPSAALLLIALESALWEDLVYKGISRNSERVSYAPVEWQYKRVTDKLLCTISGADRNLPDLDAAARVTPAVGTIEIRKTHVEGSKAILRAEIDQSLVGFFVSEVEVFRETFAEKGLAEAIQRARAEGSLRTVPKELDETIIKLRNNLIHLRPAGGFDPTVPIPGGLAFVNCDELKQNPQFIKDLMHMVVELINFIYSNP